MPGDLHGVGPAAPPAVDASPGALGAAALLLQMLSAISLFHVCQSGACEMSFYHGLLSLFLNEAVHLVISVRVLQDSSPLL